MKNWAQDLKGLFDLGFDIIPLKPKDKMPLAKFAKGWTTRPRFTREFLSAEFKKNPELNAGVRLGLCSDVNSKGYLVVADLDVKSDDPKHQAQALETLGRLIPNWQSRAWAKSGGGRGRHHVYGLVADGNLGKGVLAESVERIPVLKPKKPGETEPAWKIEFLGRGNQAVLPGSLHPSGGFYEWGLRPTLENLSLFPKFDKLKRAKEKASLVGFKFTPVDVDLDLYEIPGETLAIVRGEWSSGDRSNDIWEAVTGLIPFLSDQEILSVCTDPTFAISEKPLEMRGSRESAAEWVYEHRLLKALEHHPRIPKEFAEPYVDAPPLEDDGANQVYELIDSGHWSLHLERTSLKDGNRVKNTLKNILLILNNVFDEPICAINEFTGRQVFLIDCPWGSKAGAETRDVDLVMIKVWLANRFGLEPNTDKIDEALLQISEQHKFHPVRQYLNGLKWDGVPRLNTWLVECTNAVGNLRYLEAVSRKVPCAMVARAFEPGIKFDYVLILQGAQGKRKSSTIGALAGAEWFTDQEINIHDKDAVMTLQGKWVMELGELSAMRKADLDSLKSFVTRLVDRMRMPYAAKMADYPRQGIFIGSTNSTDYLQDTTGNRRFWPVHVGDCYPDKVRAMRDQLMAEAVVAYRAGEPLYIEDPEVEAHAFEEQQERMPADALAEAAHYYFESLKLMPKNERPIDLDGGFKMHEIMKLGPFTELSNSVSDQRRIGSALRVLGYTSQQIWVNGRKIRFWVPHLGKREGNTGESRDKENA